MQVSLRLRKTHYNTFVCAARLVFRFRKLFCPLQLWGRSIHIPDIPAWALVTGGLGAGGLFYYYNFHTKGPHVYTGGLPPT